jgi:hypothetical protein
VFLFEKVKEKNILLDNGNMDLEEVWTAFEPTEDELVDTFVDAMGNERSEQMAAYPPPSTTARGNSSVNTHRLELHTGQFSRPSKNGESLVAEFDNDMDRPTSTLNSLATRQIHSVVSQNRKGLQTVPEKETQQIERSELYNGYNVSLAALSRTPRVQTRTNRSVQETIVYGPELSDKEHRPPSRAEHRQTLKVGAFDGDHTISHGRSATSYEDVAHRADTFLRRMGALETPSNEQGRVFKVSKGRVKTDVRESLSKLPQASLRNFVTKTDIQGSRQHTGVTLNGNKDVKNKGRARRDQHDTAATLQPERRIGNDATRSQDPYIRTTFLQSAAIAEHVLGHSDSVNARESSTVQPVVNSRTLRADVVKTRRSDDRSTLSPALQQHGDHSAITWQRARDTQHDSQHTERVGLPDDRETMLPASKSAQSRHVRSDLVHALYSTFGRGLRNDVQPAANPTLQMNDSQEKDVFAINRRKVNDTLLSAIMGSLLKLLRNEDTTAFLPKRNVHTSKFATFTPPSFGDRQLNDDSLSTSHPLVATGWTHGAPMLHPESFNNNKEQETTVVRGTTMQNAATTMPAFSYNGHD